MQLGATAEYGESFHVRGPVRQLLRSLDSAFSSQRPSSAVATVTESLRRKPRTTAVTNCAVFCSGAEKSSRGVRFQSEAGGEAARVREWEMQSKLSE